MNFHLLDKANIAYIGKSVTRRTYMDVAWAPHSALSVVDVAE